MVQVCQTIVQNEDTCTAVKLFTIIKQQMALILKIINIFPLIFNVLFYMLVQYLANRMKDNGANLSLIITNINSKSDVCLNNMYYER